MRRVRTRFAPSPTGPLHIGGIRTALYSYLFAKKFGGDFILRIEDTDTAREVAGSEEIINESLKWCGITADEGVHEGGSYGPYKQSQRKDLYIDHALKLIENGSAYYAFDTEDEISLWREASALKNNGIPVSYNFVSRNEMKNSLTLSKEVVDKLLKDKTPYVIRLKVEEKDDVTFHDIVRDEVTFRTSQLDDRVLLKSDGMPTYHLANVVDDYFMRITHVIRGEEWLASTPHHVLLYKAFGWEKEMPEFAHLPLLLKPDGKGKLSKRDGDRLGFPVFCASWKDPVTGEISEGYREKGFQSEAFVNFIAMLGWNDGSEKEIFTMEELILLFSLERVHKAGAKFNYEKALWYNQQYIHKMPLDMLVDSVKAEILKFSPTASDMFVEKYCQLFQDRVHFLYELKDIGKYLYSPIENYDRETLQKKWTDTTSKFLNTYINKLSEIEIRDAVEIEEFTKREIEANQLSMGAILPVLRIGLTGITKGPSVFETIVLLGQRESISRLKNIEKIIS